MRSLIITSSNAVNIRLKSGRGGGFWPGWAGRGGAGGAARPRRGGRGGGVAGATGVALFHDHHHRLRLLRGDEVVEDEAHAALPGPARLVLAAAVLEVEDGITGLVVGVISGRGVDEDPPPV